MELCQIPSNEIFWGISTDTVFTTFITILVFVAGYITKQYYEKRKKERRLKTIREYILNVLQSIVSALSDVSDEMQRLGNQIDDITHQNIEFRESSNLFLDSIKSVNDIDFYNALFLGTTSKDSKGLEHNENILNAIEFIGLHRRRVKENFMNYYNRYREYSKKWSSEIDSIFRIYDKYRSYNESNDIQISDDPFLREFDSIIHSWRTQSEDFREYNMVSENLLNPLKELCTDNLSDSRSNELLPIIVHSNYSYEDIQYLKETFSNLFFEEASEIESVRDRLEEAIEYFRNK